MKKLVFLLLALITVTGAVFAQDQQRDKDRDRLRIREHILLKDGIAYKVQDQIQTRLQTQLVLQNGTTVNPDGTCQLQNGKRLRLKDGQCLDMNGNKYRSQDRLREKAMKQERQHQRSEQRMKTQDNRQRGAGAGRPSGQ